MTTTTKTSASPQYMLLFRGPDWDAQMDVDLTKEVLGRAMAWFESLNQQGKVHGTGALQRTGCIVSGKNGRLVTDGPFAESKEAIGGYLVVEAESFEAAVAIAKTSPTLEYGISVEVRPTLDECPIARRLRERQLEAIS